MREVRAPFDPDDVTRQFALELRRFNVREVCGDHYGGEWPASRFKAFGARYRVSDRDKSEIYRLNIPSADVGSGGAAGFAGAREADAFAGATHDPNRQGTD